MSQAIESNPALGVFSRMGAVVMDTLKFAGSFGVLSGQIFRELTRPPFYWHLVAEQLYWIGVRSFLLVAVTGLATGSVLALQFGFGLAKFGGKLYVPKIVGLSILREMGPVFVSLLVAGRIGSGIAAEVASMKVTQQIDAMRALGTSPIKRIVIPRMLAALIALPILTLFGDFIGMIGAIGVSAYELAIPVEYFVNKAIESMRMYDILTGMAKTIVFAYFISVSACWKGLHTEGGTQGVGHTTTWVVVSSSIFIMVSDYFLSKFFFLTVYPQYY